MNKWLELFLGLTLLIIIILIMLIQIHSREKNVGLYGRFYVFVKKRLIRKFIKFTITKLRK